MTPAPTFQPTVQRTTPGESLNHIVCCHDDDLALCGVDVSGHDFTDEPTSCAVCLDLEYAPCPSSCPMKAGAA